MVRKWSNNGPKMVQEMVQKWSTWSKWSSFFFENIRSYLRDSTVARGGEGHARPAERDDLKPTTPRRTETPRGRGAPRGRAEAPRPLYSRGDGSRRRPTGRSPSLVGGVRLGDHPFHIVKEIVPRGHKQDTRVPVEIHIVDDAAGVHGQPDGHARVVRRQLVRVSMPL